MVELVEELTKRNKDGKYDHMIEEAKAGEYHDFKNKKYDCGKVELATQLANFPELEDIRDEVITGEYDEPADEADKEMMRADIRKDPGGAVGEALIKTLGLDK